MLPYCTFIFPCHAVARITYVRSTLQYLLLNQSINHNDWSIFNTCFGLLEPIPAVIRQTQGTHWKNQLITEPHRETNKHMLSLCQTHTHTYGQVGRVSNSPHRRVDGLWKEPRTQRMCKLHTESPRPIIKPTTLLLWCDSANHCTNLSPYNQTIFQNNIKKIIWFYYLFIYLSITIFSSSSSLQFSASHF